MVNPEFEILMPSAHFFEDPRTKNGLLPTIEIDRVREKKEYNQESKTASKPEAAVASLL
ncbi:hypothetical protein [Pseudomonas sp. PP3]|uniref:hypothetical protein n=1 Tax=Pseudomonas sp. PP3 TaxID=2815936 RepID=UPI001BB06AEE|nr:hypothetical protein [Pseudomonas sp. PP3]